jgi:hypothetical protein
MLDELCHSSGAELIIALLPAYTDYLDYELPFETSAPIRGILEMRIDRRARQDLRLICESLGLTVVDLFPILRTVKDPDLYAGDLHIWTAGHAAIQAWATWPAPAEPQIGRGGYGAWRIRSSSMTTGG